MNVGIEALVGFVGAHGDALELLEFTEKVLDEMTPLVHFGVDGQGVGPTWMLGKLLNRKPQALKNMFKKFPIPRSSVRR